MNPQTHNNEVARLREENETLNRQVAFLQSEYSNATCKWLKAQKIVDDARLATAPEEPINQKRQLIKPPITSMEENNTQKHINTLMDALENLRRDTERHYTGYRDPDHVIRDTEARHIAIEKLSDAIIWLHKDLVSELSNK